MKKIDKLINVLKKKDNFLITSHINLEGDSIGSQLAIAELLDFLGKRYVILDSDALPPHYQFLPKIDLIKQNLRINSDFFDAAIVLDCPTIERVGNIKELIKKIGYIINIDHHISNKYFGDINWVTPSASSVGEMIYELFKILNCPISKESALFIYIAILTDTGSFNYSNTSKTTHEIVSELLGYGIRPDRVSKNIYESRTAGDMKLLGKALSNIKIVNNGEIAYTVIKNSDFKKTNTKPSSCENFVNFVRSIKNIKVAIFFREDIKYKNRFHISLRSTEDIDVNRIASFFGGGGHKNASGCTIKGKLKTVKKKLLKRIKDEFN